MAVKFKSSININDQYTLPSAVGLTGQYLSITDAAAGILDWSDLSGVTGAQSNFVYFEVKNETGSTINKGACLMAVGTDGNSGHILVAPMNASGAVEPKYYIGILEETIANGEFGKAVHFGVVDQINTNAFSDGDVLWCDPTVPGGLTVTEPEAPAVKLATAFVLNSSTNGKIAVRVQGNEGLHELHDVHIENVTDGQALVWDATQGYWKNGDVSGGASSGELNVLKSSFTGDSATTSFALSANITSESQTQVYIDGVYQSKDNYSTSGSSIVFSEAPDTGTAIEVIHLVSVSATVDTDIFNADGSTVEYTLSKSVSSENNTQIYFDGVYQSKDNYTVSGNVITFSTAPANGVIVEVVHLKTIDPSSLNSSVITGDGTTTDFTLPQAVDSKDKSFVFIQGVYQEKSTYAINGTTITFSSPPQNGYSIEVVTFSSVTVANEGISKGTTLQRPENPDDGLTRYNTDTKKLELYNGAGWFNIGPDYAFTVDTLSLTADSDKQRIDSTTY
jgi:hypothetical protein